MKQPLKIGTRIRAIIHQALAPVEATITDMNIESPEWETIDIMPGKSTKVIVEPSQIVYRIEMDCGTTATIAECDIMFAIVDLNGMKEL